MSEPYRAGHSGVDFQQDMMVFCQPTAMIGSGMQYSTYVPVYGSPLPQATEPLYGQYSDMFTPPTPAFDFNTPIILQSETPAPSEDFFFHHPTCGGLGQVNSMMLGNGTSNSYLGNLTSSFDSMSQRTSSSPPYDIVNVSVPVTITPQIVRKGRRPRTTMSYKPEMEGTRVREDGRWKFVHTTVSNHRGSASKTSRTYSDPNRHKGGKRTGSKNRPKIQGEGSFRVKQTRS